MTDTRISTALVGFGNIGKHHARVLSSLSGVHFAGICDADAQRAETCGGHYHVPWFTDIESMLEAVTPAALIIATPTHTHCALAAVCIDRGIPVLVEKPVSADSQEARALALAAAHKGVTVAVGHTERFNPAVIALKKLIDEGGIGQPLLIHARRLGMKKSFNPQNNVITELGIHDIEVCSFLMDSGTQPVSCTHTWAPVRQDNAVYVARMHLDSPELSSIIDLSWMSSYKLRTLTVAGTSAHAEINYITQQLIVSDNGYEQKAARAMNGGFSDFLLAFGNPGTREIPVVKQEPLKVQVLDFIDSIREQRSPLVPLGRAIETLELACAATEMAAGFRK